MKTNKHPPALPKHVFCSIFHASLFFHPVVNLWSVYTLCLATNWLVAIFIAFILHHYFFLPQVSISVFNFWFFLKEGRMEKCLSAPLFFPPIFLLTWLKLVYPKYASPTKVCIYWKVFSTYKQMGKLSHRKGCYVSTGYKTGFKATF